ncbi:MAG: AMP-binding protein [Myxococcales bacterium]|nr:AMP-binding protein [Myxococcales bacterium]
MNAPQNLVDAVRAAARHRPDKRALTYLEDGERETGSLTYGELDRAARALGARLQAEGLAGQRVLLIFEPGLDFAQAFLGSLYAGAVPIPAYPPEPHRLTHTMARLEAIIADAQATAVITSKLVQGFAGAIVGQRADSALARLKWLSMADATAFGPDDWAARSPAPTDLAFLQYTSGSTSSPKGVMITHGSLWANIAMFQDAYGSSPDSVLVSWLPLYHDMGLIGTLLHPLALGAEGWLMPPYTFLKKPGRWLQLMARVRGTISAAPNFAFELAARKMTDEERAALDLSAVRALANGAEPVRHETIERFLRAFAPAGLRPDAVAPSYGMAEVGLIISSPTVERRTASTPISRAALARHRIEAPTDPDDTLHSVSCGVPWGGSTIEIVHPESHRRAGPGEVGEIWVTGGHVAAGYWGRDAQTAEAFQARIAGDEAAGPFLRTGDLGFVVDGEVHVTGRRKDLLIIRGRNLYPQDLELTMDGVRADHPEIRPGCAAAISVDQDGEERLVLIQEIDPKQNPAHDAAAVMSALRDAVLRDHEVRAESVVLLAKGTLPKTSSGKVMRFACKRAFLSGFESGGLKVLARDDRAEERPAVDRAASAAAAEAALAWLRGYAARHQEAADGSLPAHVVLALGNQGLLGLQVPRDQGGLGLTHADAARVLQQAGAIDLGLARLLQAQNGLGIAPLLRHGSEAQRDALLPALARGRALATLALGEAGGTHDAALQARLADGQLQGEKVGVPLAPAATWIHAIVRDGQGFSAVIVPTEAARVTAGTASLGARSVATGTVHLDGVASGADDVLGAPGAGQAVAADALGVARLFLAAASLGASQRALQLMLRFAGRRAIDGGWLLDHPVTLEGMHQSVHDATALEALVGVVAARLDAGEPVPAEVLAAVKVAGAEAAWQAADRLVQILGGRGLVEANQAPRLLRDARALRVIEGPTEALCSQIGRALIEAPAPLLAFLSEGLGVPEIAGRVRSALAGLQAERRPTPQGQLAAHQAGLLYTAALQQAALGAAPRDPRLKLAAAEMADRADAAAARMKPAGRTPTARAMESLVRASLAGIADLDPPGMAPELLASPPAEAPAKPAPARPAPPRRVRPRRRAPPRSAQPPGRPWPTRPPASRPG